VVNLAGNACSAAAREEVIQGVAALLSWIHDHGFYLQPPLSSLCAGYQRRHTLAVCGDCTVARPRRGGLLNAARPSVAGLQLGCAVLAHGAVERGSVRSPLVSFG
jgi:hypothetical protein